MSQSQYITVAKINNRTSSELRLYLEMLSEEVVLSPGHEVELLAMPTEGLLPIAIDYHEKGLQIYPHKAIDPDWHVRFKGKFIRAGFPTVLSEYE